MSRYEGWALSNNVRCVENGPRDLLRACESQNIVSLVRKSVLGIATTPDAPSLVVTFARYPTYPTVSPLWPLVIQGQRSIRLLFATSLEGSTVAFGAYVWRLFRCTVKRLCANSLSEWFGFETRGEGE